ncbi:MULTISPECIES: HU family DNA-binding protein [Trichocoleus]|uniref:HU family DNA-binding protein n=1 Tax=Trichocoleus TaxID=450526 RepID=UPI0016841934|nr:HU family DNA-binding protein [Trichocoleus sp. FACHB-46]MBD1865534.1 HU family DNA-binding protein [Trichocoleus sp. FACHB-46]
MNKGELVDAVAEKANVTKKQAEAAITAVFDVIQIGLAATNRCCSGTYGERDWLCTG